MPHPPTLTPELLDELVALVRQGNDPKDALAAKGVNPGSERRWRQRATERPGSIYGLYRARMEQAVAEATTVDVAVISRAGTFPSTTTTTITKRELREHGDTTALVVTEETVKTVVRPADWKAAAWKLERRNQLFQPKQQISAAVVSLPPEMLNRTMGELLRVAQGDTGPTLLHDDDEEARALVAG